MSKQEKMFVFAAAILAGLVGGGLSSRLFSGDAAFAQQRRVPPPVTYAADAFRVLDPQQRERAVLGPGTLMLRDANGATRVIVDSDGTLRLFNALGKPAVALTAKDQGDIVVYDQNGKPASLVLQGKPEKSEGTETKK